MAIKLPSHLHRSRSGILHFRIAIPPDLRHHFASREIYRSLRTPNVRDAACAAQALSAAFKREFARLRQETMPHQNKAPLTSLDEIDFGLTLEINFDEFLRPQSAKLQTDPHDTLDAIRAAESPRKFRRPFGVSQASWPARKVVDSSLPQLRPAVYSQAVRVSDDD